MRTRMEMDHETMFWVCQVWIMKYPISYLKGFVRLPRSPRYNHLEKSSIHTGHKINACVIQSFLMDAQTILHIRVNSCTATD